MFDQLVESTNKKKTNKVWSFWLSMGLEALILFILILIPLIYTSALPKSLLNSTFLAAPPPPPPPPPPPAVVHVVQRPKVFQQFVAPTVVPKKIVMVHQQPQPDLGAVTGVVGGVPGGAADGSIGGILGGTPGLAPPPPPKPTEPERIGGNVMAARIINKVTPAYPQIARMAHVSGTVVLHAIIAEDGTIQQLSVISGPALLRQAALDAVRQWRYQPTTLNGQAVKVDTTVDVVFDLGD
jgi:periplasmic protein TonB